MTNRNSGYKRPLGLLTALLTIAALALPFAQVAEAAQACSGDPSTWSIQVGPPSDTNEVGLPHTVSGTLADAQGPCTGGDVNFDVDGPNGDADAPRDSTNNSPPDAIVTSDANAQVSITYSGTSTGTDNILAWVDVGAVDNQFTAGEPKDDDNNKTWIARDTTADTVTATPESDVNNAAGNLTHTVTCTITNEEGAPGPPGDLPVEGANCDLVVDTSTAGTTTGQRDDCNTDSNGECDLTYTHDTAADDGTDDLTICEDTDAGDDCDGTAAEPEDNATKRWEVLVAGSSIDCTPDTDTDALGANHGIVCTVRDNFGTGSNGINVDGEIIAGPNNIDGSGDPPDFSGVTTTVGGNPGVAQFSFTGNSAGTDQLCFWIDADNDNDATDEGDCTEDIDDTTDDDTNPNTPTEADDDTDRIAKTWVGPGNTVQITQEVDTNPTNTPHTWVATVRDSANTLIPGANVDAELTGAGDTDGNTPGSPDLTCNTATSGGGLGTCNLGPTSSNVTGTTTVRAWLDLDGNGDTDDPDATEGADAGGPPNEPATTPDTPGAVAEPDNTDVAIKTWTGPATTLTESPDTDTAAFGTCNVFTVTLLDSGAQPLAGANIDVEQTHDLFGQPGVPTVGFCSQAQVTAADPAAPNPSAIAGADSGADGKSHGETTAATNATGQVSFGVTSTGTGDVDVLAWDEDLTSAPNNNNIRDANEPNDTSTKTWTTGGAEGVTTLDCEPETDNNPDGTDHTWQCTATNSSAQPVTGVPVKFDVTAGPNMEEFGPEVPCIATTNQQGVAFCTYDDDAVATSLPGDDTILSWVDKICGGGPGAQACEPQDEIKKTWTQAPEFFAINLTCDDSDGPSGDPTADDDFDVAPGETGTDCEDPTTSQNETFTATVIDTKNTAGTGDDVPVAGVRVDFELDATVGGPPDDMNFTGGVGVGDAAVINCNTAATGSCSVTLNNPTPQDGDVGDVTATISGQVNPGPPPLNNSEDTASKLWSAPAAADITLEPAADTNVIGTQHTVTATVFDQFGAPMAGRPVTFVVTGRNATTGGPTNTDANGKASFTYTDTGPAGQGGSDNIDASSPGAGTASADKDWRTAIPTPTAVKIDMQDCDANTENQNDPEWEATDTDPVNDIHEVCATAFTDKNDNGTPDADGDPIVGASITYTLTGPGNFTDVTGTQNLGTSVTVTAGNDEYAHVFITSTQAGSTSITATHSGQSATGTKTWTGLQGRNIVLTPETATNEVGTSHQLKAKVTDRQGNPVVGVTVAWSESGPATITSQQTVTDANGEVNAFIDSDDPGTSTVTVTIVDDDPGTVGNQTGECTSAANVPVAGAPAGNCTDTATKTWTAVATRECSDATDNDSDGDIDFPDDNGCSDADDNSEISDNPELFVQGTEVTIEYDKNATKFTGKVKSTPDDACVDGRTVKLKKKKAGKDKLIDTDTASGNGVWKVNRSKKKSHGKFYAVAPKLELVLNGAGDMLTCEKGRSKTLHR